MGSRKEEERNEKIIRGLMKLPPNRHCINCNSLGPQYVCTNFWTFVCMSCSGIHREFTHRVKSVSMSKFTSLEVEALQNGGNQRAREIYLKEWDQQRQRLPHNSNVDKVREFIKNVYVDKRYAGGKTGDKPPKDSQSIRSPEDETRRASSYHSYSQSPPYDFQYEDRRYGKQATTLTRKPGSDRGFYVGKMSSFICSPNHSSDRMSEDRFANEGSFSRPSDYSVSCGGDSVRYGIESPSFQKDVRSSGLPNQSSRETKRATSLGSIGSFNSNSMTLKSYNSGSFIDFASENEQTGGVFQDTVPTFPQSSASVSHGSLDLFDTSIVPESNCSTGAPIDLFQLPATSVASSMDLFHSYQINSDPPMSTSQHSQASLPSSLGFIAESGITGAQSNSALDNKSSRSSAPKNEGWATFDVPLPAASSSQGIGKLSPSVMHSDGGLSPEIDHASSLNTNMQWSVFLNSVGQRSSASIPHQGSLHNVHDIGSSTNAQEWNAFDDSSTEIPVKGIKQSSEPKVAAYKPLSNNCHFDPNISEDFNEVGIQKAVYYDALATPSSLSAPSGPFDTIMGSSFTLANPSMEETCSHTDHRSINPFDLPCDSELEQGNMLLDMSSLQAALPETRLPPSFLGGVTESWFTQDPMMTYIPAPQGSLAYMAGQAPGPQLTNVQAQEPVASVGGNPFA